MPEAKSLSIADIYGLIREKISTCSLCGGENWDLDPEMYDLKLNSPWQGAQPKKIRCVILTCKGCGNVNMLNLRNLAGYTEETMEMRKTSGDNDMPVTRKII